MVSVCLPLKVRKGGSERYPSSKVRSNGCALLEHREEIPHAQGKRNPSKNARCCKRASEGKHTETIHTEN